MDGVASRGLEAPLLFQGGDPRVRPTSVRIDLSTCVNRYGPPPSALDAFTALDSATLRAHPYEAADQLRAAYGRYLAVPDAELVVGRGASGLIWRLAASGLANRVAVPLPAYTEYCRAFPDALISPSPFRPHHHLADVAAQLARGRVVLISNPHNPSGLAFSAHELADVAAAHPTGLLIVDESYVEFMANPSRSTLVGWDLDNVAVLRSPSKFFGLAGCRVGVAWSRSPELRSLLAPDGGTWPVSTLEVAPVVAALADTGWADEARSNTVDDARWLERSLGRFGGEQVHGVANFRLIRTDRAKTAVRQLSAAGVGVRLLGKEHGLDGDAIRVSAPRHDERAEVGAVFRAMTPLPTPNQAPPQRQPPASG